ncbi:MAG TPA: alpha/beta family hydrolase [Rhizomicrobium sp.]|jgi:predicted alpha/beta-hydrolase family hydrolase|nr:alpha/beta family hydrolase [Rhizomicrobium sp.]
MSQFLSIALDAKNSVSGIWDAPASPKACIVLAHGAGVGMAHSSMEAVAAGLVARGIAVLRYNFPYMERGSKRVDPPALAHQAVRAAVAVGRERSAPLPLFAGGRSFGARMTSQAQAKAPLDGVRGLVFFAFPLHPAGAPADERAAHLEDVRVPMLFLQGTRDALADLTLLTPKVKSLGRRAKLVLAQDADHSFHVPAKTGRKDSEILAEILDSAAAWMLSVGA